MRTIVFAISGAVLAISLASCGGSVKKEADAPKAIKPGSSRSIIAPEEIRDVNEVLLYRVSRVSGSFGTSVHEIEFFSPAGVRTKKQNYLLGTPDMHKVCTAWYYNPDGKLRESRHCDLNTGTVNKIEFHDADGKVVRTETHEPGDGIVEEVPAGIFTASHANSGAREVDETVAAPAAPAQVTPAQCYKDVIAYLEKNLVTGLPGNWDKLKERSPKDADELQDALSDLIKAINQPELKLVKAREVAGRDAAHSGGYAGIGVSLQLAGVVSIDGMQVEEVFADSPSEDAGLKKGDVIVAVDGRSLAGYSLLEATRVHLQGVPGTAVELTVRRGDEKLTISVSREVDRSLGIKVSALSPGRDYVFQSVREDTAAGKAGIQTGDILKAVDGQDAIAFAAVGHVADYIKDGLLGSKIELTVMHSGKSRKVSVKRQSVGYGSKRLLGAWTNAGLYGSYTQLIVQNLDWYGLPNAVDSDLANHSESPGLVLDLRGASGSNLQIAAQLLRRFLDADAGLIGGKRRIFGDSIYDEVFCSSPPNQLFTGKIVVLVDSKTSGTAEAVAYVLQASGRATVRGTATADKSLLTEIQRCRLADGSSIFVQVPVRQLTDLQGQTLTAVQPDNLDIEVKDHDSRDEVANRAQKDVSGMDSVVYSQWFPLYIAGGLLGCVLLVVLLISGIRRLLSKTAKQPVQPLRETDPRRIKEENPRPLYQERDDPRRITDRNVHPAPSWRYALGLILCISLVLAAGIGLDRYLHRQPVDGELIVEVVVDGSPAGQAEVAVVNRLAKEYSGPITFNIIDTSKGDKAPDGVSQFPRVRFHKNWYDGTGKSIGGSGSYGGEVTRAQIAARIRSIIEEDAANQHPVLPIERSKP